ncbi:MAG: beta-N-acetylhexosaminidase [Cyclobacteriaceae bacterium]|jgi:beta-N-acetylhexosaminidase
MKKTCFLLLFTLIAVVNHAQPIDSLDLWIGQMIMVGLNDIDDKEEASTTLDAIEAGHISGIILFEKDLRVPDTKQKLKRLIWELQETAAVPLFIGIDEEGGRVNRLKPKYGFPKTVSAQYLGEIDQLDSTYYYASQTAKNLKEHGFNVNYAPTVDVNINPENPVISGYERSYSADYKKIIQHAQQVIKAHEEQNILTVLKHFPGHGSSTKDTHLGVADVSDTWKIEELFPYQALISAGRAKSVMSSHIVNRSLDDSMLPGTLSDKMINGLLRQKMGFNGVIFTDDMHMGAIAKNYGFEESIVLAINAGVDVLMFSNNIFDDEQTNAFEMYQVIREAVNDGRIDRDTIKLAYERVISLKKEMGLLNTDYKETLKLRLTAP